MTHSRHLFVRLLAVAALAAVLAGCGASRTFHRGDTAARAGDWDTAVEYYRRALQKSPDRTDYQIALERAMISASVRHLDQARVFEAQGQLEDALREYRRASEFDPPNRQIAGKVGEVERRIRDQQENNRPRPNIQQLRDAARQTGPPPLLNLTTTIPALRFNNASLRDILNFIGMSSGINVTYDNQFADRQYSVQMDNVTLEEALNQILTANQLFYKVVNQRTIMVIPDTAQKRNQYEEQVIRTFFVNHADATELAQLINTVIRVGGGQVQPMVAANKTANTITIRATTAVAAVIERIIESNDNPRAEIVVDVQILEVNRTRAKQFGLDLGSYSIGGVFSPEADPRGTGTTAGAGSSDLTPRPFNLNTITRGINTADFYLAVPAAVVRFLETDTETKLVAKPQLRGAEGQKITLNLGDRIPIPTTVFTPLAQGGANVNPLTSFTYQDVGVNVEMTPRVTFEDDIILELVVENSTLGANVSVAGTSLPSIGSRRVSTRLRLREGESTLLAGLLREDERKSLTGFPTLLRVPVLKQLFAANNNSAAQTDIVMLLTPRIVRTHELSQQDVAPIFVGTQQNFGLGGPPPLIAQPGGPEPAPGGGAQPAAPAGGVPPALTPGAVPPAQAGVAVVPPGSSTVPGTTTLPAAPAGAAPSQPVVPRDPTGPIPTAPQAGAAVAPSSAAGGQVTVSPPGTEFRVGGGPYTVPVSITGASRVSSLSLTITFNPAVLRVRTVQEGSFMRSGGIQAAFTQQVDAATGRIDIAIIRPGDTTGVAGTGLLAAVLFDAIGAGIANLAVTGSGALPGGGSLSLQFAPVPAVTVR